ncbi:MAG: YcgL domain-containing protein, partial [Chromatiales bacterium]|nr:YcgL domain-containing protein [Chromatiales bacterium]
CWIYRSSKKQEMYLYLAQKEGFSELPEALQKGFGRPELVMELALTPERSLAREDVSKVMAALREQGFFLQMPPKLDPELHEGEQTF